ncbi:MAG TPA: hypothetical protein VNT57_05445 [Desulfobacteria bacterium]|nr:hypothetical protein [Desulfobacteria bacterium]
MQRNRLFAIAALLIFMFVILSLSEHIKRFIDPRNILLYILLALGYFLFTWAFAELRQQSVGENILDTILSIIFGHFELSAMAGFIFGLLLMAFGILGIINGPDWLGMEKF